CSMYTAKSLGETEYGSRQGSGGSAAPRGSSPVSVRVTSALDDRILVSPYRHRDRPGQRGVLGFQHEFRIAERAHLGNVETLELGLRGHAVAPDCFDDHVQSEAEREHEANERRHTDQLCDQLSRVSVEEAGDRAWHAVPRARVAALAVSKQPNRDDAPQTIRAVHGNRANDIVEFQHAFNEFNGERA